MRSSHLAGSPRGLSVLTALLALCLVAPGPPTSAAEFEDPETYRIVASHGLDALEIPMILGGILFSPSGDILYLERLLPGEGVPPRAELYSVPVTRDPATHQVRALGPGRLVLDANSASGSLFSRAWSFGPEGTLFYTATGHRLRQRPGAVDAPERAFDLACCGIPETLNGLAFSPYVMDPDTNFGMLQVGAFGGLLGDLQQVDLYNVPLIPLGDATFQPREAQRFATLSSPSHVSALRYVPSGPHTGSLMHVRPNGTLDILLIDPATGFPIDVETGLPTLGAEDPQIQPFARDVSGFPMGLDFDPVTNDLFLSLFLGPILQIDGFPPPGELACTTAPTGLLATRDEGDVKLTWTPGTSEQSVRVVRNGTELAAAAPVASHEYVDTTAAAGVLHYELTFDFPGETCVLDRYYNACITHLEAKSTRGKVELSWRNNLTYTKIVVGRGDEVLARLGGDQVSCTDTDPPPGLWTYSVAPEDGDCDGVTIDAQVFEADYPYLVVEDGACGYWRFGGDDATVARNSGTCREHLDATYEGEMLSGDESLLSGAPDNAALWLDGGDSFVSIPSTLYMAALNDDSTEKTIELWFQAELIDETPRMLYEEGDGSTGLNMYVQEVDGEPRLVMSAWTPQWGPFAVEAQIEDDVTYHAVMVFDASSNREVDDFDGRVTGYLDGAELHTVHGADRLPWHDEAAAIGGVKGKTRLRDGAVWLWEGPFMGIIDEVAVYNIALDDLDGDGNFLEDRVLDHFLVGSSASPLRPEFHRGDTDDDGTIGIADAVSTLQFLFSRGQDTSCKETQDFDNDGKVVLTDAVGILLFLFSGGPAPAAPGPPSQPCGPDPDPAGSPGDLGCETYHSC